ncbi:MAG: hypothetical protein ACKVWV_11890 [Planctomycetota bacterium]
MTILAIVCLTIGVALSAMNWHCILSYKKGRPHVSQMPFVPCTFTLIGLLSLDATRRFWWCALLVDPSIPTFVVAVPILVADAWRTSRFTRVRRLRAHDCKRHVELSLHRNGYFLVKGTFDSTRVAASGATLLSFGLVGTWEVVGTSIRLSRYGGERVTVLEPHERELRARESGGVSAGELDAESLDALVFCDA